MNKIGVIAEDNSDVCVIKLLIQKIAPEKKFTVKKFIGYGCGKIIGKGLQWSMNLRDQGCTSLIVVHDLDRKDHLNLEAKLVDTFKASPIKNKVILIPIREIEAWLLSDNEAIQRSLNLMHKPPYIPNPEEILDPKRKLREIIHVSSNGQKRYVNTIHNEHIAANLNIKNVKRCSSFLPMESFVSKIMR